jgi:hypothetical protein
MSPPCRAWYRQNASREGYLTAKDGPRRTVNTRVTAVSLISTGLSNYGQNRREAPHNVTTLSSLVSAERQPRGLPACKRWAPSDRKHQRYGRFRSAAREPDCPTTAGSAKRHLTMSHFFISLRSARNFLEPYSRLFPDAPRKMGPIGPTVSELRPAKVQEAPHNVTFF